MPLSPLPKDVVRELQYNAEALKLQMGKRNALTESVLFPKTRIRILVERVPKKLNARKVLKEISEKVQAHNKNKHINKNGYVLIEPKAHAISNELIAMMMTNAPTVGEILKKGTKRGEIFKKLEERMNIKKQEKKKRIEKLFEGSFDEGTHIGRAYFEEDKKNSRKKIVENEHNADKKMLSREMLEKTYRTVFNNTKIANGKMLLIGIRNGKYVFMPYPNPRLK